MIEGKKQRAGEGGGISNVVVEIPQREHTENSGLRKIDDWGSIKRSEHTSV